jgi:ubiquinone/menaquinone biosynthesis C-methylase UbiE
MTDDGKNASDYSEMEQNKEAPRAFRRQTLAKVSAMDGHPGNANTLMMNISLSGAYIRTDNPPPVGTRFVSQIFLPNGYKKPIKVGGLVVRSDHSGIGVVFEDLQSRDRSLLRGYTSFHDLDDAVVSLQESIPDILSGNLLPISDKQLIHERLYAADKNAVKILIALSAKSGPRFEARLDYSPDTLVLRDLERPVPENTNVIYCAILDGALHAVFEGLVSEHGEQPKIFFPERMYHNDRRSSRRIPAEETWLSVQAPHAEDGVIRIPAVDVSEGGCAVLVPQDSLITVGMRFPAIELHEGQKTSRHDGATVTRIVPAEQAGYWQIGLNFIDSTIERDAFSQIQNRSVRSSHWANLKRLAGLTRKKAADLFGVRAPSTRNQVYVCRYKNTRREQVVGIVDATFDLYDTLPPVDVAVLICQPFQVRKEVFNLLARTLVDNFKRDGLNGVVLRFDLTHMVGESQSHPDLEAKHSYFYNWTYSQYEYDMIGSLAFLERRFQPAKRVLVSLSVAAIPARRLIADGEKPVVDLWIAPFGCPDGQDQFKNYLAGVDLFQKYLDGEKIDPIYVFGRLGDPNGIIRDAIQRKMAFMEDARKDMSNITIPVTWILGTYDYIITRERVRQILNAPDGGPREIIELPSGHLLKTGPEAIESYKLISETISKHLFSSERPAAEPDMTRFARQSEAEWARVKRTRIKDNVEFWNQHLFGASGEMEGYDVFLFNPDYLDMMKKQAKLLDVKPGDRVADLGCGTGNLSLAMLDEITADSRPVLLTCSDLVPKAVQRTKEKIDKKIKQAEGQLDNVWVDCRVMDLEAARLTPLKDFLSGKFHGPVALARRIEGLETSTLRKIAAGYGPRLHEILHGSSSEIQEVMGLCPSLEQMEAEAVLDLSMAGRFLKDNTLPEDLRPGCQVARHAGDLAFKHLYFGYASRDCCIDCPSDAFDKIGASIVLPYLYDPESVVREVYRILAPGGVIVLSSPKPNFDSSKSYMEEAMFIAQRTDIDEHQKDRLLASLRELAAFVAHVLELADEGRFRFFTPDDLSSLMEQTGFLNIRTIEALGNPPTAVIVIAEKQDG